MNKSGKQQHCIRGITYVLFLLFYLWLAHQIPYTCDDWEWGSDIGIHWLLSGSINSRYAGNFFVVLMTRSELLKTLIMGICYFSCPLLVVGTALKLCGENAARHQLLYYLIANIIFLSMPLLVWQEVYSWVSGFANFGISALFMLICLKEWSGIFDWELSSGARAHPVRLAALFAVSLLGQLFIENLSLSVALFSVAAVFVYYRKTHQFHKSYTVMSIGAVIGLAVMFSSSIYETLWETGNAINGYRHMIFNANDSLQTIVYNFLYQCAVLAIRCGEANTVLSSLILLLLGIRLIRDSRNSTRTKRTVAAINTGLILYFLITYLTNVSYSTENLPRAMLAAILNAGYILVVTAETLMVWKNNPSLSLRLLAAWGFALSLIAPLILIDENGSRLFYTYIVVLCIYLLVLLNDILSCAPNRLIRRIICISLIAAVLLVSSHFVVYNAIGNCKSQRAELIRAGNAANAETVILPRFPFSQYLHTPDPLGEGGAVIFKGFFGLKPEINLIIQ